MIRLFVGIALDSEIAGRLSRLGGGIPGARWVEARNLHVTLVFLGDISETQAAEADEALSRLSSYPAFPLTVAGLGTFGRSQPTTLWAGIAESEPLTRLQAKVAQAMMGVGIAIDRRKFVPHITLARLVDSPLSRVQAFIAEASPFRGGEQWVRHITLFRSHLSSQGAEYQAAAEYPLN